MIPDLPVERVNGQEEWNWNERQTARTTPDAPGDATNRRPGGNSRDGAREHSVTARRRIKQLESKLERKEQERQRVIEQYERLLAKKNQQLAERARSNTERERRVTVRAVLSRYVDGR
jgi:hypothetical protein